MSDPLILMRLATIEARLAVLEAGGAPRASNGGGAAPSSGAVADDADLDSAWGNVRIKYGLKPKYWKEQPDPFVGKLWSQCSAEYLDASAKYLDSWAYMARKDGGEDNEKKARYRERDAGRCRGWAARIRGGWKAPPEEPSAFAGEDGGGFGDARSFGDESLPVDPMAGDTSFDFGANEEAPL